jgi:hypothetical protein
MVEAKVPDESKDPTVTKEGSPDVVDQVSYPPDTETAKQPESEQTSGEVSGSPQPWGADQITPYPEVAAGMEEDRAKTLEDTERRRRDRAERADREERELSGAHNVSGGAIESAAASADPGTQTSTGSGLESDTATGSDPASDTTVAPVEGDPGYGVDVGSAPKSSRSKKA